MNDTYCFYRNHTDCIHRTENDNCRILISAYFPDHECHFYQTMKDTDVYGKLHGNYDERLEHIVLVPEYDRR